jgi:VWFA-related protein
MRIYLLVVSLSLGIAMSAFAQQPAATVSAPADQATRLQVEAKLVVVPVVVRDKHNALVNNLSRESFSLNVDGTPQPIRYFDHDADVPLTVGLLVDTSMSQRDVLQDERTASATFLEKMLSPERDKAFVIQFAGSVELLQDVTNSRPKLQQALQVLDTEPEHADNSNASGDNGSGRHGGWQHHGGTALYDAVFLSADEVIKKQKGRRALILLTDGVDNGSHESLAKAIETAQRADAIVYAIYYKGQEHGGGGNHGFPGGGMPGGGGGHSGHGGGGGWPGGGGHDGGGHQDVDGKKILERLCQETGGSVFEVTKKETVEKIYSEIGEELRAQYRLGFTPSAATASEGYHKLTVSLQGPSPKEKDTVQTRDGYYTQASATAQ